jgi:hypothetical protein
MASGGLLPWDNCPALEIHWRLGPELGVAIQMWLSCILQSLEVLGTIYTRNGFEDDNAHSATTG